MAGHVTVAKNAGFCFGVARATRAVEQEMASGAQGRRIYTLGRLIHNEIYNQRLRDGGVEVTSVEAISALATSATEDSPVRVFVRAHGMTAETEKVLADAAEANPYFSFVDCTCSFVKKIHRIAAEQSALNLAARASSGQDDRLLLVLGSDVHPEVIGFLSRFEG